MAKTKTNKTIEELKDLLLKESSNNDESGILFLAKGHLNSDLHRRKIERAIEIIKEL